MTDADWLDERCAGLLRHDDPVTRQAHARELGARAADTPVGLDELVMTFMRCAQRVWGQSPDPHRPGARPDPAVLLNTLRSTLEASFAGYRDRARTVLTRSDADRAAFVNDLLTGDTDPGELSQRAHRYGIRLGGDHAVLVANVAGLSSHAARAIDESLAARFGSGNTLTTLRDGQLVCVSTGGLRGLPAELARHLLAALGPGRWQIAVGRDHPGVHGLATSLDEARGTLDLAAKLGFTAPVLHAADLLVFPVLLRDREAITDLVSTVLGPLRTARGGAQPYLDTLSVLFDNQENYTATARHLHLSVRAVTYRLDRIRAMTGYHPSEPTQRFTLHTAVLGARLLGWPDR